MARRKGITKIRRPAPGCVVAFVAVPGLVTALGMILGGALSSFPIPLRIGFGSAGVFFLLLVVAFVTGSAGVLVDAQQRTVQLYFSAAGLKRMRDPIQVQPDDQLVVDEVVLQSSEAGKVANARLSLVGPERQAMLMGTRTREEALKVAAQLSKLLDVPIASPSQT